MIVQLIAIATALIVADRVTPIAARLAHRTGCVAHANPDVPTHVRVVPLLGGLAIAAGLLPWLIVAAVRAPRWWALGLALVPVLGLGAYKDRVERPVAPRVQLVVQLISAVILWCGGFRLHCFEAPLDLAATVALALVVLNAWNFIDIMDGLAAGVAAASTAGFVLAGGDAAIVAAGLAGGALGYLRHNWPPARIFMGDLGSFTIGLTFVALILDASATRAPFAPLVAMIVPLGDFAFTTLSRAAAGKSPLQGGAEHLPLRLAARGWSGVRVNATAYLVALTASVIAHLIPSRH